MSPRSNLPSSTHLRLGLPSGLLVLIEQWTLQITKLFVVQLSPAPVAAFLHFRGNINPRGFTSDHEDGGSPLTSNAGKRLPHYAMPHRRKRGVQVMLEFCTSVAHAKSDFCLVQK
jgi:hypothetical protein